MPVDGLSNASGWVLWVTETADPERFAEALQVRVRSVKPVAIPPQRLEQAIAAVRPAGIAIDGRLRDCNALLERSAALFPGIAVMVTEAELASTRQARAPARGSSSARSPSSQGQAAAR